MMAPRPGPPLRKVTLNLFEEDCRALETIYGDGWTIIVRDLAHNHVGAKIAISKSKRQMTLGDFLE